MAELWAILCPGVVRNTEKLKDFYFTQTPNKGNLPCTFQWLKLSKPEFYSG